MNDHQPAEKAAAIEILAHEILYESRARAHEASYLADAIAALLPPPK